MIAQTIFIGTLSPSQYDARLAEGWFRDCMVMYRSDLVVLNSELFQVTHIRFALSVFSFRKSQRRVLRNVESRFRVVIGKPCMSASRSNLYQQHIKRFRGFVHPNLEEIMFRAEGDRIHLREVAVYDGRKLIAVSYFEVGKESVASLLALYNSEYCKYSLGYYTMLKEVEWGMANRMNYYYPGYLFDLPSEFDYKLRLGTLQSMNRKGAWVDGLDRSPEHSLAGRIRERTERLGEYLVEKGVTGVKRLYPYFTAARMMNLDKELFSFPVYYEISDGGIMYAACYDPILDAFLLQQLEEDPDYQHMLGMPMSDEYRSNPIYQTRLMRVTSSVPIFPDRMYAYENPLFSL